MMKKSLQKTIAAAFALALPLAASADWKSVYTEDFEDSETYSANWTTDGGTTSQGSRTVNSSTSSYLHFYDGYHSSGSQTAYYTAPDTTLLTDYRSATQWKASVDFGATWVYWTPAQIYFQSGSVADGDTATIFSVQTVYGGGSADNTSAVVRDASGNSVGTLTVDAPGFRSSASLSTWYTLTMTCEGNGVSLSIEDANGETVVADTLVTSDDAQFETITFNAGTGAGYGNVGFDDIIFYVYTDEEVVETPTAYISAVNGTEREVTMECETDDVTIYYTENGGDTQTYSEPVTVSETTTFAIWAESASGTKSETYSYNVEAGVEVSLADITYSVTGMTEVSGLYYPTYAFSIDNRGVL